MSENQRFSAVQGLQKGNIDLKWVKGGSNLRKLLWLKFILILNTDGITFINFAHVNTKKDYYRDYVLILPSNKYLFKVNGKDSVALSMDLVLVCAKPTVNRPVSTGLL